MAAAAASGLCLLAAALAGAPAIAQEPLAELRGLPEGPVREVVTSTVGTEDAAPTSLFDARRRAARARDRALAALRSEGYYGARVDARVEPGDPPRAQLEIDAGERFVLGTVRVEVSGSTETPAAEAAGGAAGLEPGAPARAEDVLAAETRAVAAVEVLGFPDVRALDPRIVADHARHAMDVTLRIDSGRAAVLGPVRTEGTARVRDQYIARLTPFEPGDRYNRAVLDRLADRLRETGAFESVTVKLAEAQEPGVGPQQRDVIATVQSGPRRSITLGAIYSTSEGAGVEGSWTLRNVFGGAESFTVAASLREIEQRLGVQLEAPHWRRYGRTARLDASLVAEQTDAYDRQALEASARLETQMSRRLSRSLGVGATLSDVDDGQTVQQFALLFATGSLAWDGANDPLNPTRGARASGSAKPTAGVGDDPVGYVVVEAAASAYQRLSERFVVAVRGRVGDIVGPSLAEVPADERFFAGGGGSIRGYEYQSVSPRNPDGTIAGGRSLLEVSTELRYHANGKWGYVAFLDGGAASDGLSPEQSELRWGAGVGVRYFTRAGPIRADIATPIDRRDGEPAVQFYISIGQAF